MTCLFITYINKCHSLVKIRDYGPFLYCLRASWKQYHPTLNFFGFSGEMSLWPRTNWILESCNLWSESYIMLEECFFANKNTSFLPFLILETTFCLSTRHSSSVVTSSVVCRRCLWDECTVVSTRVLPHARFSVATYYFQSLEKFHNTIRKGSN